MKSLKTVYEDLLKEVKQQREDVILEQSKHERALKVLCDLGEIKLLIQDKLEEEQKYERMSVS